MGEVMERGVIGMPFEMAMDGELSRRQFYEMAQRIFADRDSLHAENERLKREAHDDGLLRVRYGQERDQLRADYSEACDDAMTVARKLRAVEAELAALHAEAEALQRQVTELTNQRDAILLQARCWAGEAKAQQSITKAVGEALGGVPSWGPIAAGVEALRAENAALRAKQGERQEAVVYAVHAKGAQVDHHCPLVSPDVAADYLPGCATPLYTSPQPGPDVRGLVSADDVRDACANAVSVFAEEANADQCREVAEYMREVLLALIARRTALRTNN